MVVEKWLCTYFFFFCLRGLNYFSCESLCLSTWHACRSLLTSVWWGLRERTCDLSKCPLHRRTWVNADVPLPVLQNYTNLITWLLFRYKNMRVFQKLYEKFEIKAKCILAQTFWDSFFVITCIFRKTFEEFLKHSCYFLTGKLFTRCVPRECFKSFSHRLV